MRRIASRALGAIAVGAGALTAMGVAPAPAVPDVGQSSSVTELTAQMADLKYVIDPATADGVVSVGQDGTITQVIGDQQMVGTQDGSWTIGPVSTGKSSAVAAAAYPVSGCTGSFSDPVKINQVLEHGAQQVCTEGAYPHSFQYLLRSTCTSWYCHIFVDEGAKVNSLGGGYTRVATLQLSPRCQTTNSRQYQQTVWPMARGVKFGPWVNRDEPTVACDISA